MLFFKKRKKIVFRGISAKIIAYYSRAKNYDDHLRIRLPDSPPMDVSMARVKDFTVIPPRLFRKGTVALTLADGNRYLEIRYRQRSQTDNAERIADLVSRHVY